MIDPVGVVGLTIAIFDQILKLGERTAQLISDIRAFDEETKRLQDKLSGENNRNVLLRALLFNESKIYPTKTLFESFPESIQEEIQLGLGEAETIISEAIKILEKQYGKTLESSGSISPLPPTTKTYFSSATGAWFSSTATQVRLISWSMRGKKRVEKVVMNFANVNAQLTEKIKLCSFALTSGINLKGHLERMKCDPVAQELGFDIEARLLGHMDDVSTEPAKEVCKDSASFEAEVTDIIKLDETFSIGNWAGLYILLEQRYHTPSVHGPQNLDPRTRGQIEMLVKLLQQPRGEDFRIPPCLWWTRDTKSEKIWLAFSIGSRLGQPPTSLHHLLGLDLRLSLNHKFELAYSLTRCLSQFQLVGWVHESIRSSNILFWSPQPIHGSPRKLETILNYHQPWILGFEFSRPDANCSVPSRDTFNKELEIYKHPDRQGLYNKRFTKIHDIYALGIVLLEIGIWETALKMGGKGIGDASNPLKVKMWYIKQAERRLEPRMGRKYKEVVLKCLNGDFGVNPEMDTHGELKLQQAFRRDVVDVLERAKESL